MGGASWTPWAPLPYNLKMPLYAQLPLLAVLFAFGVGVLGTATAPALAGFLWVLGGTAEWALWPRAWALGVALWLGYLSFGLCLMALTVVITRLLPRLKPGEYAFASPQGVQWFFSGVLAFLVSKLFLDFLLMTGVNIWYFRLMGAKIGKGVQINTKEISDFHLIEIGDGAMIGGRATVIGHLGERGKLRLRPVKIGARATIGLGAVIFPGAQIGERAVVGAGAVVPKDEVVPPGSVVVGAPARAIKRSG